MKLKINKKLIALTLAGVMLSLTGCGAEKENNEVSIINEYNETNYDKDLFKEIGVSDYIIENEDFKNIIAELKENNFNLYGTIINNDKIIGLVNENNEQSGAIICNTKDVVTMSYRLDNAENYNYVEKDCTYEFDKTGKSIGSMITENYFDIKSGTIYTITTTDDNLFMQAVTLRNENNQELGISIGKPDGKTNLLIVNDLELEIKDKDYKKIEKLMYKNGKENNFTDFPADVINILDNYKVHEVDNIAYKKTIKA